VNTLSDGILHISPFQTFEEGAGASLVKWFEYGGGLLTDSEIRIPGSDKTFRSGDLCPDGKPGQLQVFVTRAGESAEERLEADALQQYIPHDGDRIRIVFGPEGDEIVGPDRTILPEEQSTRTIEITIADDGSAEGSRFEPDRIEVAAGETVTFAIRNAGQLSHVFRVAGNDGTFVTSDDYVSDPEIIVPDDWAFAVVRLDAPGEVPFRDETLDQVTGTIVVRDAP
jgi:plastocyanin